MNSNQRKASLGSVWMRIASVLFCLVLISTSFTSGLYARYVSKDSGTDSARVIAFRALDVDETGDFTVASNGDHQFIFIPGVNLKKNFKIEFGGSESATIVFAVAETVGWSIGGDHKSFTDTPAKQMAWSVADGWEYLSTEGNCHVYYQVLEPNTKLDAAFIKDGEITVSPNGTCELYASYAQTQIILTAYAVQANGFQNVSDAWASVK